MDELKKVVVFIPALDEMDIIGATIDKVREIYSDEAIQKRGYVVELLVVDDGCTDNTVAIVKDKGVGIISHSKNLGLGAATRTGMEKAYEMGADVAVKLDADLQHDPMDIEKVVLPILEDKTDICWGSRFAGKINYKMPLIRYVGNKFFTWFMNQVTNYKISDAQTGLMAYSRKYLKVFELWGNYNPPQQLLVDANLKSMRYFEVPVTFNPRTTGKSFVSLKYPFYVLINILRVVIYANPLKVFSTFGMLLIVVSFFYFGIQQVVINFDLQMPIFLIDNLSLHMFIVGLQTFFFGILADLIINKK
jgi:glycosyltransferase involved in cell wall biosynthesis